MAMLTEHDIYLFREGTHANLYRKLGWLPEATMVTASGDASAVRGDLGAVLTGR